MLFSVRFLRHAEKFKKMFDPQAKCMSVIVLGNDRLKPQNRDEIAASRMFTDGTIYTTLDNMAGSIHRFLGLN